MAINTVRPDWDEYFMEIATLVSSRSTCLRRAVGAVIVKDRQILATGYNGPPRGIKHCGERERGCLREELGIPSGQRQELSRAIHAEQNAIIQSAYHGTSIKDATIYTTTFPCVICAKMIINAGIREIFFSDGYPDDLSKELIEEAGIVITKVEMGREK